MKMVTPEDIAGLSLADKTHRGKYLSIFKQLDTLEAGQGMVIEPIDLPQDVQVLDWRRMSARVFSLASNYGRRSEREISARSLADKTGWVVIVNK